MSLKLFNNPGKTPIEFIDRFSAGVSLYIKREDLIHPQVSGNKWRKLKYNMIQAIETNLPRVLTFGGAFSNHIHATAAAGAACGIRTIGLIRGEISQPLNPTLAEAAAWGMELVPISREDYRKKTEPRFLEQLLTRFGKFYLIPEGGTNPLAVKGCAEITQVQEHFDYWCISCGTGGTLAGLVTGLKYKTQVEGFPALKGGAFLENEINRQLIGTAVHPRVSWRLHTAYHFGGYAKISDELIDFIRTFKAQYQILLDPIYTGKMMFGIWNLIGEGFFKANSRILAVHTGGLQGIAGIEKKHGIKIK